MKTVFSCLKDYVRLSSLHLVDMAMLLVLIVLLVIASGLPLWAMIAQLCCHGSHWKASTHLLV